MSTVMSLFFLAMLISFMSHINFKKGMCCRVEFKGQGPYKKDDRIISGHSTGGCEFMIVA